MMESIQIENFGPIHGFAWDHLAPINLVIGRHGTGKTFLLKALYCALRALEEKQGDEPRSHAEILADKLYWTFQPDSIGDLVGWDSDSDLSVETMLRDCSNRDLPPRPLCFSLKKGGGRADIRFRSEATRTLCNTMFLPTKEVLSLHNIILRTREDLRLFGFDDTYLDLARALRWQPRVLGYPGDSAAPMEHLKGLLGGHMKYNVMLEPRPCVPFPQDGWRFKTPKHDLAIGMAAEGARKIAILDTLLRNGYLRHCSIVLIDEPEAALHPEAISTFLDVIAALVDAFDGTIQFFLASHSYFVVKKLYLIAQSKGISLPVAMADGGDWEMADLKDGMPSNPIVDEAIRLYKEEVELAVK